MNKDIRRSVLMELESDAGSGESLLAGRLGLLGDLKVDLDARVGSVRLSLSALGGLKAGEVVTLDSQPDGSVDMLLNGTVVARGRLVVVDDFLGVQVETLSSLRS